MTISRSDLADLDFSDVAGGERLSVPTTGKILRDEFMQPLGLSARALARAIGVPPNRVTEIINGTRAMTAETAVLLGRHFCNSPRFWMNLQVAYDLEKAERSLRAA